MSSLSLSRREIELNHTLTLIAESLDISPSDYERAVRRYQAVGSWLEDGLQNGAYPGSSVKPKIYPHGSIRLGTIVKPLSESRDAAYDVDLVCELQYANIDWSPGNAETIKHMVGNRLKSSGVYRDKLEPEGRRCWSLEYAESARTGFHIDVLPCVPDMPGHQGPVSNLAGTGIRITDKDDERTPRYGWSSGNPIGYAQWFHSRNTTFEMFAPQQRQLILKGDLRSLDQTPIYKSIQQIPNELIRTPLQRSIQILKRHRDTRFKANPVLKPISMIITTLSAQLHSGEEELLGALLGIVSRLSYYAALVENRNAPLHKSVADLGLIQRTADGKWYIPNPVNPQENFADRWHEEEDGVKDARARAFFEWVDWVKRSIEAPLHDGSPEQLLELLGTRSRAQATGPGSGARSLAPAAQRAISRFSVPHRQQPRWPIRREYEVTVTGTASRNGFRPQQFNGDSRPLPKHCSLRFEARTDTPWPYKVYWQVVNTGDEARAASGLRGGYYDGIIEKGGRARDESTLYSGTHWVECFIVKDGVCVARSGEFVVNIE